MNNEQKASGYCTSPVRELLNTIKEKIRKKTECHTLMKNNCNLAW
ncbi:MAG: hypothetical protein QNJ18_09840 [Xenococcaceae cyanobacterium MO_167.B52]|nr:hypothetical protein [Xenococcaceae cyanobacterium MO_167.B52]